MRIVVVGGGTATNAIEPVFPLVAFNVVYVVPISDNGGSTSEVSRVFGGPAIGDARSRSVRLMDPQSPLRSSLSLRLSDNTELASQEWAQVVDGTHPIWEEVVPYMKAMYRAFLVEIHAQLSKKMTPTTASPFNFTRASVGNLSSTGARIYFGTLEAAIEFVLHTTRIPSQFSIVPCLDSGFAHHIAAKLKNGQVIVGQSAISHPSTVGRAIRSKYTSKQSHNSDDNRYSHIDSGRSTNVGLKRTHEIYAGDDRTDEDGTDDDGTDDDDTDGLSDEDSSIFPFSHPSLRTPQIVFTKDHEEPLPSPIDRLYYVNMYGDEIRPKASTRVLTSLQTSDAVIFSIGSLYTSIIPVLLLQGFAAALPRLRVLILNGTADRETEGMTLEDHVRAVNCALTYSSDRQNSRSALSTHRAQCDESEHCKQFITAVVYPEGRNADHIMDLGIKAYPASCPSGEYNSGSSKIASKKCLDETGPSIMKLEEFA